MGFGSASLYHTFRTAWLASAVTVLVASVALSGCGGGGGGTPSASTGSSSSGSSTGSATSATTRASLTLVWAARSRSVAAPASALSAVVTLSGANVGSGDTKFTVNRNAANLGEISDTQTVPGALKVGSYPVTVQFYSQANGGGTLVGQASRVADVSGATSDLGDFAVAGTIAGVQVAAKQTVAPGATVDLAYTPVDASGAAVGSVTAGSAQINVVSGQNILSVANGQIVGVAPGVAQVTVTIDGKTSVPQTVGVGQASVALAASGARGLVTLQSQVTSASRGVASTVYANAAAPAPVSAGWFDNVTATAPAGYGDVVFDHWEIGGQNVSQQASFTFLPSDNNGAYGSGTLTAVYKTRSMPSGGFAPNFNQADNLHWSAAKFPLRVYVADSGLQARVASGFDWWVRATGGTVSYKLVNSESEADVKVVVGTLPQGGTGEAAQSAASYDVESKEIQSATITFTSDAPQMVDPRGDFLSALSAHELGHVLGLISAVNQGHSSSDLDTMYFRPALTVGSATERDVNSIENLYPSLFGGTASGRGVSTTGKSSGKTATLTAF